MNRRHDLDALRAFAMLLGIALHAALSFAKLPWLVQDSRHSGWFGLLIVAVHGFRMPLFFLLSGYFTALLWRKRGLRALLANRWRRIVLPLLLGLATIVPVTFWVSSLAVRKPVEPPRGKETDAGSFDLWRAAAAGHERAVAYWLRQGVDVNAPDAAFGASALTYAVLFDRDVVVAMLLKEDADPNQRNRDGGTPLHAAAFLGRAEIAWQLLEAGADAGIRNQRGDTPADAARANWWVTQRIMEMLRIPVDEELLRMGRAKVLKLLGEDPNPRAESGGGRAGGATWLVLTQLPVFHHLWFLWFLCWMVAGFAIWVWVAQKAGWTARTRAWAASPWRYLWLVPLTAIPSLFMGRELPNFGPDTSTVLLPPFHLLAYYAVFFGFGALCHDSAGEGIRPGRRWWLALPLALLLLLPLGLAATYGGWMKEQPATPGLRVAAALLQAAYAWAMCAGLMGLFQRLITRERFWIRYLSDASYWMYLAHLPLMLAAQIWVRDWPLAAGWKFLLICGGVSALLLGLYQAAVRHTWIGRLLNGPRARRAKEIKIS